MYAAMPAILKDAIERAYTSAGWDLIKSENRYSIELFPTFGDVMIQIKQVLNESDYSSDNKGDYIGSLVTRMRSLTNGINGVIFQANEISAEELFDKNVIVDISRVGSSETKALIMGILVLKLQEHRMTNKNPDSDLAHVTVLEEAHNLLRRTSTEQSSESSNLLGKSVEMLSNAIAEMRTYGEGFIIADQSPGLLDMSVIRNTNTKIIMNLPDFDDRELVGRAAGLKDEQIVEIAKLPTGVAAVYQNKWIEAVLCKIDKYDTKCKEYRLETNLNKLDTSNTTKVIEYLLSNINEIEPQVNDIEKLKKSVIGADILSSIKLELLRHISLNKKMNREKVGKFITYIVDRDNNIFERANSSDNIEEWNSRLIQEMTIQTDSMSIELLNSILECLIHFRSLENPHDVENFNRWMEYMGRNVI
jgi:ATP-binding protein